MIGFLAKPATAPLFLDDRVTRQMADALERKLTMTDTKLRNVAIIADVDHGKTTLVNELLKQSGAYRANQQVEERALDSNDLERERGITILAKCTAVDWGDLRINIVDTPGHADFGGEVERILSMVDGVLLLVDAAEGPMPQTKFVLSNRPDPAPSGFKFDLFAALGADDDQLDFHTIFASAKQGWASEELDGPRENLDALFNEIVGRVPPPEGDAKAPFSLLATTLEADPFLGRILTGRIHSGVARHNMTLKVLNQDGDGATGGRLTKLLAFRGLNRVPVAEARAGDIVAIAGITNATVADTLCAPEGTETLAAQPIDPPTLAMTISVNDSPLAGREGSKVTSRVIRDRLMREAEGNVAIRITESLEKDAFEVAGRGELQLGVLIETMRREGFELSISRPRVLFKQNPEMGAREEPIEKVQIDVDDEFTGVVVEKMANRKAEMTGMAPSGGGKTRISFPGTVTRPDRLSRRISDRHPRHRHHAPAVPRLWPLQGFDPGAPQWRSDFQRHWNRGALRAVEPGRPRLHVHPRRCLGL